MLYPYVTLNDNTEIVHSETLADGSVKVYIETPDAKDCFHHMTVYLPSYRVVEVYKYTKEEVDKYMQFIHRNAHLIIQFAAQGGFENAEVV